MTQQRLFKVTSSCGKTHMSGTASMPRLSRASCCPLHSIFLSGVQTYTFLPVTFFTPADTCTAPIYSPFQFCLPQGQNFFRISKKFSKLPYVCLCSLSSKTIERGHVVLWLDQSQKAPEI